MQNHRRPRKLSLQSLEQRHLLAAAAFSLQLFESTDDGPGQPIAANSVQVGEEFYVELSGIEFDSMRRGIGDFAMNLRWNPNDIALVEEDFDVNQIFTSNLPLYRGGTYDQSEGRIRDLRASQFEAMGAGRPVGDGEREAIALLHFIAIGESEETEISIWEGASGIYPVPYAQWRRGDIRFEPQKFSVQRAPSDIPTIETDLQNHTSDSGDKLLTIAPEPEQRPEQLQTQLEAKSATPTATTITADDESVPVAVPNDDDVAIDEAAPVDQGSSLSFDMNRDGVFDLADFGLLNVNAEQASRPPNQDAGSETLESSEIAPTESVPVAEITHSTVHSICTAAPSGDSAAVELWLDALAQAWIADAEAREQRRRGRNT